MNVRLLVGGEADLEDIGDVRNDIGCYHNRTSGCTESIGDVCAFALTDSRMEDADGREAWDLLEDGCIPLKQC
jgi:hypothetical protein